MTRINSGVLLRITVLALLLCVNGSLAQSQAPSTPAFKLTVDGDVEKPLTLSLADLALLPRREVRAREHYGSEHTFVGAALADVLRPAGVPFGDQLRGENLARFLVVQAADRYRAVFALPELDPAFTNAQVILAYSRDGQPLSEKDGPVRIVVPNEKRQGRWVRQVVALTIRRP